MTMQTPAQTVDNRSLAIGVLSVTACVLFVGFLLLLATPRAAQAEAMSDRGGDYVMVTHRFSDSREGVLVMDAAAKRMIVYGFDNSRKDLLPVGSYDFGRIDRERDERDRREAEREQRRRDRRNR